MLFAAGIAGFLALVASATAFVAQRSAEVYKNLFWTDDINLVYFRTGASPRYKAVVSNIGDGPVFVSEIIIFWAGNNQQYDVNKPILAGEFSVMGDADEVLRQSTAMYDDGISNKSGAPSDAVLEDTKPVSDTVKGTRQVFGEDLPCFTHEYYNEGNTHLERMGIFYQQYNKKLVSQFASGQLGYFSLHTGKRLQKTFPVRVIFARLNDKRCSKIPLE